MFVVYFSKHYRILISVKSCFTGNQSRNEQFHKWVVNDLRRHQCEGCGRGRHAVYNGEAAPARATLNAQRLRPRPDLHPQGERGN
ncbi:hypothetical protein chiPu_0008376 [Chiloscyllium punctatum]|uniref:Uncharacterized protein n=1 Tax=Chiloscyllium punctatum TaxID=137246 RepID=A0A401SHN8_CHIPU|nr:hypothetical protein [Chiloscyllium punctatum]